MEPRHDEACATKVVVEDGTSEKASKPRPKRRFVFELIKIIVRFVIATGVASNARNGQIR